MALENLWSQNLCVLGDWCGCFRKKKPLRLDSIMQGDHVLCLHGCAQSSQQRVQPLLESAQLIPGVYSALTSLYFERTKGGQGLSAV